MRRLIILLARNEAEVRHAQENGYAAARNREEAGQLAPWAAEVMEMDCAWIAYESAEDARIAQQQT